MTAVSEAAFTLQALVEIDGTALDPELEPLVEQIVVDENLHLPSMFQVAFRDIERNVLAQAGLKIGSKVVVRASALGDTLPTPLITGEVTALEAEYDSLGARALVRGYDPSHRFHRGRRTHTYRNVTDSEVAHKVAQRAGVDIGKIDSATTTYEHLSQANVSDWEFLKGRAREIGYEIAFRDGKFYFTKPVLASGAPAEGDFSSENPLQLVMGQDLLEFRPRVTSAQQVPEVEARGWDPIAKKELTARAAASATSAELSVKPTELASRFKAPHFVATGTPLSTQSTVDALAAAVAEQIGSSFAEAVGVARGNPKLKPGKPFSVSIVADEFAGRYTASATRHVFDRQGYRTEFTVSGRQERSLLGLTGGNAVATGSSGAGSGGGRISGVVVATVTGNDDPDKLGRVKLKFPWLDDQYESDWAWLAQLGAGPQSGAVFVPEVGDEVLVAFEFGDFRRPYVIGSLYNGVDKPRLGDALFNNGRVNRRGLISRKGHRFVFFDEAGDSGIALLSSDSKLRIALKESDSEIHVYGDGRIVIEATRGLDIKCDQNISIEASGQLTLKGARGMKVESGGVVDIDGSVIQLN
jgi:phage protein D